MTERISITVHCFNIIIILFQGWMVSGPEQIVQ